MRHWTNGQTTFPNDRDPKLAKSLCFPSAGKHFSKHIKRVNRWERGKTEEPLFWCQLNAVKPSSVNWKNACRQMGNTNYWLIRDPGHLGKWFDHLSNVFIGAYAVKAVYGQMGNSFSHLSKLCVKSWQMENNIQGWNMIQMFFSCKNVVKNMLSMRVSFRFFRTKICLFL